MLTTAVGELVTAVGTTDEYFPIVAMRSTSMVPHRDLPAPADATTRAFLISNAIDGADATTAAAGAAPPPSKRAPRFNRSSRLTLLPSTSTIGVVVATFDDGEGGAGEAFIARSTSMAPHRDMPAPADAMTRAFLISYAVTAATAGGPLAVAGGGRDSRGCCCTIDAARSISIFPQRDLPADAADRMPALRFW
jgi:hypothetical protein